MLRKILCVFALLAQGGDTWSFHLTPCAAPSAETARTARTGALSIAETVCALKCPTEPVLERFLAPFAGQAQEPLLSLRRLDDFCDPRITRTLAIAVAVLDKKIFWKKCHTDDEDRGGCMTPFSDKDTWRWLRMLQEILEVVDVKDALFLVQCGDEPNVPTDEEAFPVFHSEGGDGFWNIPWLNPFHLKALHKELLSPGPVPIPWASKMRKVYWRGSLTAPNEVSKDQASSIPRLRIFQLAKEKPELFDVAVNSVDNHLKVMWGKKTVQRIVSQHGVNFSNFEAVEQRARHYRYVLNLNGVVSSWRLSYLLGTGSVLLLQKSSTNEALHALLEPWRHYVPLAPDLSNLLEVLQQLESNETWAQTLAQAAADLFAERPRPEDIYCFALRSMEVSQSTELTLAALEARNFQAAPSLESLDAAWRGRLPKRLSQRLAAMHDALLRRPSSHTEL